MILTITFNPSIDYIYFLDKFLIEGEHNRVNNPVKMIGGKGLNASRALQKLGAKFHALTVSGSAHRQFLTDTLANEHIPVTLISIQGDVRNALTFMNGDTHTELVEKGPTITEETMQEMLDTIKQLCSENQDISVISVNGSIISDNTHAYAHFLEKLQQTVPSSVKILMDISQQQLLNMLKGTIRPYFIKPNTKELSEIAGYNIETKDDVVNYLDNPLFNNIPFILVSMGGDGAIAKVNGTLYDVTIPKITVVNPTGSGDSTVAGICHALDTNLPVEQALALAMACGMSNAMEQGIGVVNPDVIKTLIPQINVTPLS